jgi:MFS superfamily sulfate permease-like transporter
MMTGALALGAGLARLGFLAIFISEPVLKGFIIGLAKTIIIGRVPKLLGIIGIVVSLLLLLYRSSRPYVAELGRVAGAPGQYGDLDRHPENEPTPGVAVLRVESGLFFANAEPVRRAIHERADRPGVVGVVLDAEAMAFVDVTAVRMLEELADELARRGQRLVLAHDLGQVGDLLAADGSSRVAVHRTIDEAIVAARRPVAQTG